MTTKSGQVNAGVYRIRIDGMSCQHCIAAVWRALGGVKGVSVDTVEVGRAVVRGDAGGAALAVDAINSAGFEAQVEVAPSGGA